MKSFYKENEMKIHNKTKTLLNDLPFFAKDFFISIEPTTTALTRLNYLYDLRIFFYYLNSELNFFNKSIKDLTVSDLNQINSTIIESFLSFLTIYEYKGKTYTNNLTGKSRKLSSIRSFLNYYFNKNLITSNESCKVKFPKLREKNITRLEVDEIVKLLNVTEGGVGLTKSQASFHKHTKHRDVALITLLLGTGIRVSECVGLNMDDIDFNTNSIKITRKGGSESRLYFSDEIKDALITYIEMRKNDEKNADNPALFISLQNTRLSQRAVQNLIQKYAKIVTPLKNISPHKLRSTFGTTLYHETQDIYVVADILGHKDINTTKKHYAEVSDELRRRAARSIKLK